jgi:hypothetical protein
MKYQIGQTVILLNTEFKPITEAVVKDIDNETQLYLVEYQFPKSTAAENVWVKQERLLEFIDLSQFLH